MKKKHIPFISEDKELDGVIASLNKVKEFAIDLEFDKNLYRYGFNLCLVQVATGRQCFLIDPLSKDIHIERLFPVLENDSLQKVGYAFGEDLRLLHSLGCFPKNIFDLSVAVQLLDYPPLSLAGFLDEMLNVKISKSAQRSNWYKRPLTAEQADYAAQDVLHLLHAKKILVKQARQKKIYDWIEEENSIWNEVSFNGLNDNNFIKDKDRKGLTEHQWFVLQKLITFRETVAEQFDKPSYQVFSVEFLKEIVQDASALDAWEKTKGIYRALKTGEFKQKLKAVLREADKGSEALGLSQTRPAKSKRAGGFSSSRGNRKRIAELKKKIFVPLQKKIAEDYGENTAKYILSNRVFTDLISGQNEKILDYRKNLFLKYAHDLNLDLNFFPDAEERHE